jgi:hypothetical protein
MTPDIPRIILYSAVPFVASLILSRIVPDALVPWLWLLSAFVAGVIAAAEWILEYHGHEHGSNLAWRLYDGHPWTGWPMEQVRRLADRQVPRLVEAGGPSSQWPRELVVRDRKALAVVRERLKERIFGHDEVIDAIIAELGTIVAASRPSDTRPWLRFLFVGGEALGKRSLAVSLGQRLSPGMSVIVVSVGADGFDTGKLLSHVKAHPASIVIFDGLDRAGSNAIDIIGQILDGRALPDEHGHAVTFRDCQVFLLSHHVVTPENAARLAGGFTVTVETVAQICGVSTGFIFKTQGQFVFSFPNVQEPSGVNDLIEIVRAAFEKTAGVLNIPLANAHIPSEDVTHEIKKVVQVRNFSELGPRVERYLRRNKEKLVQSCLTGDSR